MLNEKDLNSKALLRLVQDQKVSFSVVLDKGEFGESLKKIVNARDVIPQTFVIKDGRIWRHFQGYNPVNSPQLLRKALDETYGAWSHEHHPELKKGVERYIRNQRRNRKPAR